MTAPSWRKWKSRTLELDSRAVSSGDIFVAVIGHAVDGRRFIDKAIELGASGVIAQACEEHVHGSVELRNGVAIAYVQDLNQELSALAGRVYQSDATQLDWRDRHQWQNHNYSTYRTVA